jgi:hypothetical protein
MRESDKRSSIGPDAMSSLPLGGKRHAAMDRDDALCLAHRGGIPATINNTNRVLLFFVPGDAVQYWSIFDGTDGPSSTLGGDGGPSSSPPSRHPRFPASTGCSRAGGGHPGSAAEHATTITIRHRGIGSSRYGRQASAMHAPEFSRRHSRGPSSEEQDPALSQTH